MKKSTEIKFPYDEGRIEKIKQNWLYLKELNIKKAHLICTDDYSIPKNKDIINQQAIFDRQIEKYVKSNNEVAILNAFPLFWFEYIDENKLEKSSK